MQLHKYLHISYICSCTSTVVHFYYNLYLGFWYISSCNQLTGYPRQEHVCLIYPFEGRKNKPEFVRG